APPRMPNPMAAPTPGPFAWAAIGIAVRESALTAPATTTPRPICFARLTYDIEILLLLRLLRPSGGLQPVRLYVVAVISARHVGEPAARLLHIPEMFLLVLA